jgi:hypothetical protein
MDEFLDIFVDNQLLLRLVFGRFGTSETVRKRLGLCGPFRSSVDAMLEAEILGIIGLEHEWQVFPLQLTVC